MAELRSDLSGNVRDVSKSARQMTDWRFYVRRFPWAVAGLAVAAGFLLIPRKKKVIAPPDQEALAEMVRKKQLRFDMHQKSDKQSMLSSLMVMGVTWAAKAGMAYLTEQMKAAAAKAQEKQPEPPHEEPPAYSPPPSSPTWHEPFPK